MERRDVVTLCAEEVLDSAWSDHRDESARDVCEVGHGVPDAPGEPQESTRRKDASLLAYLVVEFSLQHDHHLVLCVVDVKRRSARVHDALEDGHESVGLLSCDFQGQGAATAQIEILERPRR